MYRTIFFILLSASLLVGCSLFTGTDQDTIEPEVAGSLVAASPTAASLTTGTPLVESTPTLAAQNQPPPVMTATTTATTLTQAGPKTLNVWLISEVNPSAETPGGTILAEQLTAFETNHPDIQLNVEVKASSGQGSSLSYLRTGRSVAPSILPDLVALPASQLSAAAGEQLIYPLDSLIPAEAVADLYPVATQLATVGDQLYGYPFALSNLTHLAYNTGAITSTLPLTWDEFAALEDITFAFPGAGQPGAELALQLYLASGGQLANESGQPMLQVEPLTAALSYLNRGRDAGLLPIQNSNLTSLADTWQVFNSGEASSTQTIANQYFQQRFTGLDSGYAPIPGTDQPLSPLLNGWVWAISTPDPIHQATAAELLNWLSAGPNMGDWSQSANRLPARRTAFEQWPEDDPYTGFLQGQLEESSPFPASANSAVMNALSTAVFEVLSLTRSPQLAAEAAVASLQS